MPTLVLPLFAIVAGVISFSSPCCLPLPPIDSEPALRSNEVVGVGIVEVSGKSQVTGHGHLGWRRHPVRWIGAITELAISIVVYALASAPPSTYSEVDSPLFGRLALIGAVSADELDAIIAKAMRNGR